MEFLIPHSIPQPSRQLPKQMKIQCDVCNKDEASVFCTADEAVLCDACDHRVHHANKLASKHLRFSLLHPSSNQFPVCDVCQEKRAFLFCQQDRAILCRDCDVPIHTATEHTQKHNRFLLTGIKLSPTSTLYSSASAADSVTGGHDSVPDPKFQPSSVNKSISVSGSFSNPPSITTTTTTVNKSEDAASTSSISEYLIETLPGWHVEDFLDSSSPFGFSKAGDGSLSFLDADFDYNQNQNSFSSERMLGIWVPQPPTPLYPPQMGGQIGLKETKDAATMKTNRRWSDDALTVPQISPASIGSKRSRPFW